MSNSDQDGARTERDAYRKRKPLPPLQYGHTGVPRGPLGHVESPESTAIGFCPRCHSDARKTTTVRGAFNCPTCSFAWYDDRVGEQTYSLEDFIA